MFTGIVKAVGTIDTILAKPGLTRFSVAVEPTFLQGIETGASVAIDGVCLTVVSAQVSAQAGILQFDAIAETLKRTSLKGLEKGKQVNVERSARFGDEIGGHILSGHIYGTAVIIGVEQTPNNCIVTMECAPEWTKYLIPKGYIALNGVSLTLVDVDTRRGRFTVHLIPETLKRTTFGAAKPGDGVNIEFDTHTQTVVDTLERIYASKSTS